MKQNQNRLPKISIVVPSYNKVEYIEDTLKSILKQNYSNMEIIVQDGGSTDGTLEILKKYDNEYKNMKLVSEKDNGQTDAINKGLKRATGELLTFINADDVYSDNALYRVSKLWIENPDVLWIAGQGNIIDDKGRESNKFITRYKNLLLAFNYRNLLLMVNYLVQPSIFFSKRAYQSYGPFIGVGKYVLEYDFWLKLSKVQMPKVLPDNLASFRLTMNNASATSFNQLLTEDLKITQKYTSNQLIIYFHYLHNLVRMVLITLLKKYE